ncbi:unnamed protein product [Oikopleura dioica]|uniref:Uncharacterized protein n=1 Tax=Oikopleura dioica TaxID=34765 RepID=E4XQJ9_OIKDI|nr:unnamed protein product [Oikopleura dioica]
MVTFQSIQISNSPQRCNFRTCCSAPSTLHTFGTYLWPPELSGFIRSITKLRFKIFFQQQVRRLESEKTFWNDTRVSLEAKIRVLKERDLQKDEEIDALRRKLLTSQKSSKSSSSEKAADQPETTTKTEPVSASSPDSVRPNLEIYAPKIISNCSSSNSDSGHSESEINPYSSEEIDITC